MESQVKAGKYKSPNVPTYKSTRTDVLIEYTNLSDHVNKWAYRQFKILIDMTKLKSTIKKITIWLINIGDAFLSNAGVSI